MRKPSLEYIPDLLTGKLLQVGLDVFHVTLNHDNNRDLGLFADFNIYPHTLEEGLAELLLIVGRTAAEFFVDYAELKSLVVRVFAMNLEQGRGLPTTFIVRGPNVVAWNNSALTDAAFVNSFEDYGIYPEFAQAGGNGRWFTWVYQTDIIKGFRRENLDHVPRLIAGMLWAQGLAVNAASIYRDRDGFLALYFEFPLDEETGAQEIENIFKIIRGAQKFLGSFPELKRLIIWTRPDFKQPVAISPFWLSCEEIIAWGQGELTDDQLLALRQNYNP